MAVTCPVDLDTIRLRQEIQSIYARVATDPSGAFALLSPTDAFKVISTTPRPLLARVERGDFLEALYYRLNVITIDASV